LSNSNEPYSQSACWPRLQLYLTIVWPTLDSLISFLLFDCLNNQKEKKRLMNLCWPLYSWSVANKRIVNMAHFSFRY
jgi:hypothetical protein